MKKIFAIALTAVFVITAFTACGGGYNTPAASQSSAAPAAAAAEPMLAGGFGAARNEKAVMEEAQYDMAEDADYEAPMETGGGVAGPTVAPVLDSRKIIKNVSLQMQTLTFDSGVEEISKAAETYGGYVQDSYIEGSDMYSTRGTRTANFTLRIPSERLDALTNALDGQFNITSKSQNSQDITDTYFDSKARLDSLKIQEERLLEMLKTAGELEYMLQVEKELMNVRYEIESLTSSLNRMDSFVSLSTVSITLFEVVKYEPVEDLPITFGQRISRAFSQSLITFSEFSQDLAVALVSALPFLIIIAVIVIIVVSAAKRSAKKRGKTQIQGGMYQNVINQQNIQHTQNTQNTTVDTAGEKASEPSTEPEKK